MAKVDWLKRNDPQEEIPIDVTLRLAKHGRPKKGEEKGDAITLKRGSTGRAYILARLDRDGLDELARRGRTCGEST